MKLFYCFAFEMMLSQRIGKRFEGSAFEKWPLYDDENISPLETKTVLRIEISPPIIDEINGIEMNEMESIGSINGIRPPAPRPCYVDYCSMNGWESLDSNDGTGDHESFK